MSTETEDDKWLDALTGCRRADEDEQSTLVAALGEALRREPSTDATVDPDHEEQQLHQLLARLDREGWPSVSSSSSTGDAPPSNVVPLGSDRTRPRSSGREVDADPETPTSSAPKRSSPNWFAMAASVLLVAGAALIGQQLLEDTALPPWAEPGAIRSGVPEPVAVSVAAAEEASAALSDAVRALGLEVERYKYGERWIVDFRTVPMDAAAVDRLLRPYGLRVPPDGRVLIAFTSR